MSHQRSNRLALIVDSLEAIGRSWWTLVGGVCMSVALIFAAIAFLPKSYDATAKIRVDLSQAEESEKAGSTVDALAAIHRDILENLSSRAALLEALTEVGVEPGDPAKLELAINSARRRLEVSGPNPRGIVELVYSHDDPRSASRIVNALADGFVERKSASRPELDAQAVEQLELALTGLRSRVEAARDGVAAFSKKHPHASPEQRSTNTKMLSARRQDLAANRAALSAAEARLDALSNQGPRLKSLARECVAQSSRGNAKLIRLDEQLEALGSDASAAAKAQELEALLVSYEPTREELRAHRRCNSEAGKLVDVVAPTVDEIARSRSEIERLNAERGEIRGDIAVYEQRLEALPLLEQERAAVLAEYELLLAEYKDYESRLFEARRQRDASRAELAGMFEVTEKSAEGAMPNGAPSWGMILGGLGFGFLLFLGPVTVRGFLFPAVTSEAGLRAISPVPVLVSVPELPAHEVVEADRRRMLKNIALSLMVVVMTLAWIVTIHKGL